MGLQNHDASFYNSFRKHDLCLIHRPHFYFKKVLTVLIIGGVHTQNVKEKVPCMNAYVGWACDNFLEVKDELKVKVWSMNQFQERLRNMTKSREGMSGAIWKQIAATVGQYVSQTDLRRSHLAELKRLDVESAAEIVENEDRIRKEEILIEDLREEYNSVQGAQGVEQDFLEFQLEILKERFLKARKNLQSDLQLDEKQITLLTDVSGKALTYLKSLDQKGQYITNIAETCKKFRTDREKVMRWIPISSGYINEKSEFPSDLENREQKKMESESSVDVKISEMIQPESKTSKLPQRPKTSIPGRVLSPCGVVLDTPTPEPKTVTTIQNIVLQAKSTEDNATSSSSSPVLSSSKSSEGKPKSILERCFDSLKDLEGFWFAYNKVEVDFLEIKEEKKVLEKENKQLRGMIRAVLEAAALTKSLPSSKVSTRLPSRRRSAYSAPFRRVIIQ